MRIGLLGDAPLRNAGLLVEHAGLKGHEIIRLRDEHDPAFVSLDVLVSRTWPASQEAPAHLTLLQLPAAGTETIDLHAIPAHVAVCNAIGHENAMAEYVLGTLVLLMRNLLAAQQAFRERFDSVQVRSMWPYEREVGSSTVAILGAGGVAMAIARQLAGLGAKVRICSRHPVILPEDSSVRWHEAGALGELCDGADALVIACPLTPATADMVRFEHMRRLRRGVLVNVSRAGIVRVPDILQALEDEVLVGAALDVWDGVTPEQFNALKAHPAVFVTPHLSAWTQMTMQRRWLGIAENLCAYARGGPLGNVVRAGSVQERRPGFSGLNRTTRQT